MGLKLAIAIATLWLFAATASARPHDVFIAVDTDEDLADLLAAEEIDDATFEALLTLLARGVDLETASRDDLYALPNLTYAEVDAIIAHRNEHRGIGEPASLVSSGILTEETLRSIQPFLLVAPRAAGDAASIADVGANLGADLGADIAADSAEVDGQARIRTRWATSDTGPPPLGLHVRVRAGRELRAGIAVTLTRGRLDDVAYDPERGALVADGPAPTVAVPKLYVRWDRDDVTAIIGSFRAGFGQRLTFDTSTDPAPDGFYPDDQLVSGSGLTRACRESAGEIEPTCDDRVYHSPDFGWRDALFGAGLGVRRVAVGAGSVEAFAWASWHRRSVYQYELYDAARCDDPRRTDADCAAPAVYRRPQGALAEPTTRLTHSTLPDVFTERVAAARVAYVASRDHRRTRVGATGYLADSRDRVDGIELDYQEWSSRPSGGHFGAIGVDGAVGVGRLDLAAELAHSLDAMPDVMGPAGGGGGPAAYARATIAGEKRELAISARYLGTDFVNPLAGPEAAADELEGQRARDEAGARIRYAGGHGRVAVRVAIDGWRTLSDRIWKGSTSLRGDVDATRWLRWGLGLDATDKGLGTDGDPGCYDASPSVDDAGASLRCTGRKVATTARVRVAPSRALSLASQIRHAIVDDVRGVDGASAYTRHDLSASLVATYAPLETLRLRGRVRYVSQDVADPAHLEESLAAYLDATIRLRRADQLRLRGDLHVALDDRTSTAARSRVEPWFWLEYEARY